MTRGRALGVVMIAVVCSAARTGSAQNPPSAGFPPADAPAQPPAQPPPPAQPAPPPPAQPAPPPPPPAQPAPGPVQSFPTAPPPPPPPAPRAASPAAPQYAPQPQPQPEQALGPYQRPPWMPKDEAEEREAYVRVGPPGIYRHDGLYFRFAGGLGSGRDRAVSGESFEDIDSGEATAYDAAGSGLAAATEVALGFTAVGGLVLGAAIYTATIPSIEVDDVSIGRGKYELDVSQLAIFSPHVDFYPNPDGGLHFQGGFGFAAYISGQAVPTTGDGEDGRAHTATGLGFMLGIGHEWWVAEQWSLGLLGRVLYAWTSGTDPESVDWTHKTFAPTVMITATYH